MRKWIVLLLILFPSLGYGQKSLSLSGGVKISSDNTSVIVPSLIDQSLTSGNCVQATTGGLLVTTAGPCGTSSGTMTATGSPTTGAISIFSGATSVTTSDLSGDVTTSGTVATKVVGLHFGATAIPLSGTAPTSGQFLKFDGVNIVGAAGSGAGTVTSFSAGDLSPLFTSSVGTSTTTPALTFSLSNAAANSWFGNATGAPAAPAFNTTAIPTGLLPFTYSGNTTQLATWSGATTASRCVHTDASGNLTVATTDCPISGGSGTPGGADTNVQYNNAGNFGGDSGFSYNSGTHALTLSGSITGPIQDKNGQWLNVKAYGAVGDGTTDDTTAIQNTINACPASGCTIFFPPGKYKITSGLTATPTNGQGIEFLGAGPAGGGPGTGAGSLAASYIWVSGTGVVGLTVGTEATFNYNGPVIRNLGFHEVSSGTSAGALKLINQSYPQIQHVMVEGFTKAGLSAPATPTATAGSAGSLATATYYVTVSYVNPSGESLDSSTKSVAVTGPSGSIAVTSPLASGNATCYKVYAGTSASALHLQNLGSGCVNIGTGATITTLTTTSQAPLNYDESAAFGVMTYGTMNGFGAASAFSNQPIFIDYNTTSGTLNGIVADREVSALEVVGGNINQGSAASGCGIISNAAQNIETHFENGGTGSTHLCLSGYGGYVNSAFEAGTSASVGGIKGIGLVRWEIHASCSGITGAGAPINLDSAGYDNWIWARGNGTCANPMITDASSNDNTWSDEAVPGSFKVAGTIQSQGKTVPILIASGTAALGTNAIPSGSCATAVTASASGVLTTDTVTVGFNADPTAVTGYGVNANGNVLSIYPYPTANNVNFKVCNSTAASITPGALTLNWRVTR